MSAIDASPAMVRIAQSRGVIGRVRKYRKNSIPWTDVFDGVISNFGALNCVADSPRCAALWPGSSPGRLSRSLPDGPILSGASRLHFIREVRVRKRRVDGTVQTYAKRLDLPVYYPFREFGVAGTLAGFPVW